MQIYTSLRYAFAATALMAASSVFAAPKECDLVITKVMPTELQGGATSVEFQCTLDGINGMIQYNTMLNVKTTSGETYTTARFSYTTDWSDPNFDDYNIGYFSEALEEGTYYLEIPAKCIYDDINNTDAATVTNKAYELKLVVGAGGGGGDEDDDTYFKPTSVDPTPDSEVDSSMSDWTIAFTFGEIVTVNAEKAPYLLYNDETIASSSFFSLDFLEAPKQANANFNGMNERPNGEYTLILPSGAVSYADGRVNKEMNYTYTWNGGKKDNNDPKEDLKFVSASISSEGNNYDLLNPDTAIAMIPAQNAYLNIQVEPATVEAVWVRILDVTFFVESQYASAEAIWSNMIDVTTGGGYFSKEIYSIDGYKLYEDRQYVLEVQAYSVYQLPITEILGTIYTPRFKGASASIKFSPAEVLSIEPVPGSEFNVGDTMVITFSQPINLQEGPGKSGFSKGNAGWGYFTSMTSNADKTVWSMVFPASEINAAAGPGQIAVRIWGKDNNGLLLCPAAYNVNEWENDAYNVTAGEDNSLEVKYAGYAKCPTVIVTPAEGSPVKSLSEINFSITGHKEMNYSWMADNPVIYNDKGENVAEVIAYNYVVTESTGDTDVKNYAMAMPLSKEITEDGIYTLDLPWNLFVVGREQSSYPSAPGKFLITVDSTVGVEAVETPGFKVKATSEGFSIAGVETGAEVKVFDLAGVCVASVKAADENLMIACPAGIYVIVVNGNAIKAIR